MWTHTSSSAGRPVVATECWSAGEEKSDMFTTLVFNYLLVLFHLPFLVQPVTIWQVCTTHAIFSAHSSHEHCFNFVTWLFSYFTSLLVVFFFNDYFVFWWGMLNASQSIFCRIKPFLCSVIRKKILVPHLFFEESHFISSSPLLGRKHHIFHFYIISRIDNSLQARSSLSLRSLWIVSTE